VSDSARRLVVTDLDGSLLDHESYDYAPAKPVLARLEEEGIPVVFASSKTRAEIQVLRKELGNHHPYIVENGAAVIVPVGYFDEPPVGAERDGDEWRVPFAPPREHWLGVLDELRPEFGNEFEHFAQGGVDWIVARTGLDRTSAQLANQRNYSEPVAFTGDAGREVAFIEALGAAGATVLKGGRFLSVAGDCDKGRALVWLRDHFRAAWGADDVLDLAIGDSQNDCAMLEAAGAALLIRSPVHSFPELSRSSGVIRSVECGPRGWAEGVSQWLSDAGTMN